MDCAFNWARYRHYCWAMSETGRSCADTKSSGGLKLSPGSCLADIGCGTGGTLENLERAGFRNLSGIDYSDALLARAGGHLNVHLVQGTGGNPPLESERPRCPLL